MAALIAARAIPAVLAGSHEPSHRQHGEGETEGTALRAFAWPLGPGHFDSSRTGDALMSHGGGRRERLEAFFGRYLPQMIVAALAPVVIFIFMALIDLSDWCLVFLAFALHHPGNSQPVPSLEPRTEHGPAGRLRRPGGGFPGCGAGTCHAEGLRPEPGPRGTAGGARPATCSAPPWEFFRLTLPRVL